MKAYIYPEDKLAKYESQLTSLMADYQEDVMHKLLELSEEDQADYEFYAFLNQRTREVEKESKKVFSTAAKVIAAYAGVRSIKKSLKMFTKTSDFYLKRSLNSYKTNVNGVLATKRLQFLEEEYREELEKKLAAGHRKIKDLFKETDNIVISVGKRSFKLENYVRLVFDQETRKYGINVVFEEAVAQGAVGIRISDHNTKTPLCDLYEGKSYYFDRYPPISLLDSGLPPFHPGCQHFIIPIYEH